MKMHLQLSLWILSTALLVYISRRSLRHPGSHGFYRFFAWEAILALTGINFPRWFANPFAPHQLISWILLLVSLIPLIQGISLLKNLGESGGEIEGSANFGFENTSHLITTGIYSYIRHPLYASLLYLAWGIYLKNPGSSMGMILAMAASIFLYLTACKEESENARSFGAEYTEFMKKTKRFIPHLF